MTNPKELEQRMRDREMFASLRIMPGAWTIVRLDGRTFSHFTAGRYEKPFDQCLRDHMTAAAQALIEQLNGLFACTHSDEISVLFPQKWDFFGRRVEKIVSIIAGLASAAFTKACSEPAHFDSRVWQAASIEEVIEYFKWRQADSARCALHGWCYWTLRKEGLDGGAATRALKGAKKGALNELLFRRGINFNDLPVWQRRGVGLYFEACEKTGYDPIRNKPVAAKRRRLKVDLELPMGGEYERLIKSVATPGFF